MAGVFISYRRQDSAGWAGRLATDLVNMFGPDTVFQDIDGIRAGEDFREAIDRALDSCSVVLVLIGPDWSTIEDNDGAKRLDDPDDFVRLEVSKALLRESILVIPVLLGSAQMPGAENLPGDLKPLALRNALELSDNRWDYDIERLADRLEETADLVRIEKSEAQVGVRRRTIRYLSVLGVVLAATLAVVAYFLVNQPDLERAFEAFSIDKPANNQTIPLGTNQTWMLKGKLQAADKQHTDSSKTNIKVEVYKLQPERLEVSQDGGKMRISTERGLWRFESAQFSGEGSYEILTTISIGNRTDWRSVTVKCIPKEIAYQRAIKQDREIRGASAVDDVKLGSTQLPELKRDLNKLQQEFFVLLRADDLDGAEANVTKTLDLLDPVLPKYPNDWHLQNVRAYTFKNLAMVMRNRGNVKEFQRALAEAERMFEIIREQKPDDPGAWNGLGSVALLKKDPESALMYIDRALELNPNYQAAKHDREIAVRMLEHKKKSQANPNQ